MWLISSSLLDITALLLGGVLLLCLLWWLSTRHLPGIPPGPGGALPLLGHTHLLKSDPRAQYRVWRRQYGDVFSLYVGGKLMVVLSSYSAIREALVKFGDVFSHRPKSFPAEQINQGNGANLRTSASDLFIAGTETTSAALQWAFLFFLHNPDVEEKCFKEISEVIGLDRYPTMQNRPDLTYVEATIWEVLRKGDIVPFSLLHASSGDVTFLGYIIPKDTILVPDLSSVLQDPEIWADPENFRPERFIGPDGKLTRPDEFIPFGIGRRVCLGESLARMELFLYLTTLIQRFCFLPAEEGKLPPLEGVLGITHLPQPYTIRAVPRI